MLSIYPQQFHIDWSRMINWFIAVIRCRFLQNSKVWSLKRKRHQNSQSYHLLCSSQRNSIKHLFQAHIPWKCPISIRCLRHNSKLQEKNEIKGIMEHFFGKSLLHLEKSVSQAVTKSRTLNVECKPLIWIQFIKDLNQKLRNAFIFHSKTVRIESILKTKTRLLIELRLKHTVEYVNFIADYSKTGNEWSFWLLNIRHGWIYFS